MLSPMCRPKRGSNSNSSLKKPTSVVVLLPWKVFPSPSKTSTLLWINPTGPNPSSNRRGDCDVRVDDGTKDGNDSEDFEDEETDSDDTEDGDDYDSGDDEAYRPGPELFDQDDDDDVPLTTVMKKKQRGSSSKMKQIASSSKGKGKEKVTAESAKEQRKRKKLELLDNKDLNDLVWVIAKSSTMAEYDANMDRMKRKSQDAWAFLNRNPAPFWSRAGFSHFSKSDALLNNYCEQLNSKLVKMRAKPIITMLRN
ncbi:uncharacterized protein G2W53_003944 [Senna tora]|uniref:Uncharacterized protein n=1 Tax=Senna tora TaxID=362788 RepID=A0A835CG73_9FABA|nr:uncharacterized protein G2W53_003944 [Senna tora]